MLGRFSDASSLAYLSERAIFPESPVKTSGRNFRATLHSRERSSARNASPLPTWPVFSTILKYEIIWPISGMHPSVSKCLVCTSPYQFRVIFRIRLLWLQIDCDVQVSKINNRAGNRHGCTCILFASGGKKIRNKLDFCYRKALNPLESTAEINS
jgi:hypothetical protein